MADKSPTDGSDDQNSSVSNDETLLEDQQSQDTSADEPSPSTASNDDESQDAAQDNSQSQDGAGAPQDNGSSDDEGLAKFIKSQGYDPEDLSETESKALKIAHDNVRSSRKSQEELAKASKEMEEASQAAFTDDDGQVDAGQVALQEIRLMRHAAKYDDFDELRPKMAELINGAVEDQGADYARMIASDLDYLYYKAKEANGDNAISDAREAGRKEERSQLRKKQEAAQTPSSARANTSGRSKVTRSDIVEMPDEEYAKLRDSGELDKIMESL